MFRSSFVTLVRCSLALPIVASLTASPSFAQQSEADAIDLSPAAVDRAINRGIDFLRNRGQASDGSFSGETGAAVTGLCLRAILEHRPLAVNDPVVKKGSNAISVPTTHAPKQTSPEAEHTSPTIVHEHDVSNDTLATSEKTPEGDDLDGQHVDQKDEDSDNKAYGTGEAWELNSGRKQTEEG